MTMFAPSFSLLSFFFKCDYVFYFQYCFLFLKKYLKVIIFLSMKYIVSEDYI